MKPKMSMLRDAPEELLLTSSLSHPGSRRMRGQSLLEFAIVAPLLFLLVFALLDFGRLFYVQITLQDAVRQAGRYAVTGNHKPDPKNPGKNLSRVDSITQVAQQAAGGLDVTKIQVSSARGGKSHAGGPGDTVTISLTTNLQFITPVVAPLFGPRGIYQFTVARTFRNEPFSPDSAL